MPIRLLFGISDLLGNQRILSPNSLGQRSTYEGATVGGTAEKLVSRPTKYAPAVGD
ncbi:MAG: hypothetical protein QGG71_26800 [Pirellulaceae bacterium]|nr:hypothetical protein [Pirellulaceae bacterium]